MLDIMLDSYDKNKKNLTLLSNLFLLMTVTSLLELELPLSFVAEFAMAPNA